MVMSSNENHLDLCLNYADGESLWPEVTERLPLVEEDRRLDQEARRRLAEKHPDDFVNGELCPNNRFNLHLRIDREWDKAVNRVFMGQSYRKVARDFNCAIGTLHKRVKEYKHVSF
ncbi:MAG: hypothetical protein LUG50_06685 [Planctomycetaceae bacterium]|nr:hypothetical protein [Planctomycetaceae bacterium]